MIEVARIVRNKGRDEFNALRIPAQSGGCEILRPIPPHSLADEIVRQQVRSGESARPIFVAHKTVPVAEKGFIYGRKAVEKAKTEEVVIDIDPSQPGHSGSSVHRKPAEATDRMYYRPGEEEEVRQNPDLNGRKERSWKKHRRTKYHGK